MQRYSIPAHSGGGPQPLTSQQPGTLPSGQDPPSELPLGPGRDWTPAEPTSLLSSLPCPYLLPTPPPLPPECLLSMTHLYQKPLPISGSACEAFYPNQDPA